jgi:hypothetical protein
MSSGGPERATVTMRDTQSGKRREVEATIRISPAAATEGVELLNITAWQGGGSVVDPLERVAAGTYRTTKPIPVHAGWKALLRVQRGDALVAVPLYMPEDRAIPAPEVPAAASFTRAFQPDVELLQRERKQDVAAALTVGAYLTVLAIALGLIGVMASGLLRLEPGARKRQRAGRTSRARPELV